MNKKRIVKTEKLDQYTETMKHPSIYGLSDPKMYPAKVDEVFVDKKEENQNKLNDQRREKEGNPSLKTKKKIKDGKHTHKV